MKIFNICLKNVKIYCIVFVIGNENKQSVLPPYILHRSYICEKARWCYGNFIITNNISTILWTSRSLYHSYCLDYCVSGNFEQIKNNHSAWTIEWLFKLIYWQPLLVSPFPIIIIHRLN